VRAATDQALNSLYRHIGAAAAHANEAGVGEAVRGTGIPRDEIFITTKLHNADQGHEAALRVFESSDDELRLDVIDLNLIHWPYPCHNLFMESWKALEKLRADGLAAPSGCRIFSSLTSIGS
jgi:2,5-diketo-D-gluconate reductase A